MNLRLINTIRLCRNLFLLFALHLQLQVEMKKSTKWTVFTQLSPNLINYYVTNTASKHRKEKQCAVVSFVARVQPSCITVRCDIIGLVCFVKLTGVPLSSSQWGIKAWDRWAKVQEETKGESHQVREANQPHDVTAHSRGRRMAALLPQMINSTSFFLNIFFFCHICFMIHKIRTQATSNINLVDCINSTLKLQLCLHAVKAAQPLHWRLITVFALITLAEWKVL